MKTDLTILIIDDSTEDRETYKRFLTATDTGSPRFIECDTGEEGLDILERQPVDCIILDYNLPDIDGIEVLFHLSGKKDFASPVILLTGQGDEMIAVQAMKYGARDYLVKNRINPDLLNRTVRYAIEKQATDTKLAKYVQKLEQANQRIKEQQKAVIEEERLKVILQIAGATAHEFNQPLMILLNGIKLMEMDRDNPDALQNHMALVTQAGERIADIVKKIQSVRHYETQAYAGGEEIFNLDQSLNLLVIENNDEDYKKTAAFLKGHGNCFRAEDLHEGVKILKKKNIDLILMEYVLPSGTALDFLSRMETEKIDLPLIVATGSGDETIASKTIKAGAIDYLPKSKLTGQTLVRCIETALSRFNARRETTRAMEKITQMATHDELTGLFNRRYFDNCLAGEIERANRYKTHFSLFLADLDFFKKVNDTHGHTAGDKVLKHSADMIRTSLRQSDIPCRFGGEEFAVILPNTLEADCRKTCERFRKKLEGSGVAWGNQTIHTTVSIGVTSYNAQTPLGAQALIDSADQALYRAKNSGRNRVC